MSERSNSVLVGAFIVGALVIAVAGALFFAGGGLGGASKKVVMVFDGSLRGLTVGAPVALRGVTIGQVTDIDVILDGDKAKVTMLVVAEIDPSFLQTVGDADDELIHDNLVAQGLRARLDTQSLLTGLLYVQLDFHPDTEIGLTSIDSPFLEIPTIPTELEQLRQSLESIDYGAIADNVDRIATGMDKLLNNPDMQALPSSLRSSLVAMQSAGNSLNRTLDENAAALSSLVATSNRTMESLNESLPAISDAISDSLAKLDNALEAANQTMASLENAAAPDSPPRRQLSQAMQDLSLAARALRSLARSLDEHPEALLRGRQGETE
ncbi:MAG: MlaD family protein [Congregibacter sp.]